MEYAGFWMRVIAYVIDWVLVEAVMVVVAILVGMGLEGGTMEALTGNTLGLVGLLVGLGYWAVLESSSRQATVGKMVVGLKVTDLQGNRISFARALGRTLAKLLSGLLLLIGYFMVAFTARKQGLHDKLAGTLVVHKNA